MGTHNRLSLIGWSISNLLLILLVGFYISLHPVDVKTAIWMGIAAGSICAIFAGRAGDEERSLEKLNAMLGGKGAKPLSAETGRLVSFMIMLAFATAEFCLLVLVISGSTRLSLGEPFKTLFACLMPYLMAGQLLTGLRRLLNI